MKYFIYKYKPITNNTNNMSGLTLPKHDLILPNNDLILKNQGLRLDKGNGKGNGNIAIGIFDFDGNILATETQFFFKNKITGLISTCKETEYTTYANDENYTHLIDNNFESVVSGFRDFTDVYTDSTIRHFHRGPDGLINDIEVALEDGKMAPSFNVFKDLFLIKGRIIAILTARGHSPDNIERGLKLINKEILNKEEKEEQIENIIKNYNLDTRNQKEVLNYYFGKVIYYMAASNKHFCKYWNIPHDISPAIKKTYAMNKYISDMPKILQRVAGISIDTMVANNVSLSLGFSDDSTNNIIEMFKHFAEESFKSTLYLQYKIRLYFTGDKSQYQNLIDKLNSFKYENIGLEFHEQENQLDIKIIS